MNQEKIGAFISKCRKEKNLTQNQLAENLNVTNKAISRWETGRGMPDTATLLPLCKILDISVNELLSGEKLSTDKYQEIAEKNIISIAKEADKRKSINKKLLSIIIIFVVILFISVSTYIVKKLIIPLTIYNKRETVSRIDNLPIHTIDLSIDLKDVKYNKDNNNYIVNLEFRLKKNKGINNLKYDFLIYDENYNIIATSMFYTIGNDNVNNYIIGFTKEKYNSLSYNTFAKHISKMGNTRRNISDIGIINQNIEWQKDENINSRTLNIILNNIEYQDLDGNVKSITNTDFLFQNIKLDF